MPNKIIDLTDMYEDYFLDYASYVILERAIPKLDDGLKPVQRRILHALFKIDDGRFHKVANVIGQTMQYHPHGDAAIGAAMVHMGQKELILDTQGNWGDIRTGDSAAASRYIEVRLSKFALAVAFNPKTTDWQLSYDGRKEEPIALPMKFPLLLSQGVEGIAVGLSTKILPHNFVELLQASIKILQEKNFQIYPDFQTGGLIDVEEYNKGKRGGKVKVRARIHIEDKKTLLIQELPYGVNTGQLIDSILKANEKGKIKIKAVTDNTAQDVEIRVDLQPGTSPEQTRDALYAFTSCEVSISPNACIIIDDKPHFVTVHEILKRNTDDTKELLRRELEIELHELQSKWHFASLEKIFIENRIYRDIEECESWEEVLQAIDLGLQKYVVTPSQKPTKNDTRLHLQRDITEEDITRLTEIRIKRISKYNVFAAEEKILKIQEDISGVEHHLANLVDFTIAYYQDLLERFGKGRERRTEIKSFQDIERKQVVANNVKLYLNAKEGFIGTRLKNADFVTECSDIDDIIAFRQDGLFQVSRIDDKVFMGKDILHVAVWTRGDERTTYNAVYRDGKSGRTYAKRFQVQSITRDKEYHVISADKSSKLLYFSANSNGEAETVKVHLSPSSRARKKILEFDFSDIDIKGRSAKGNIVTKYPVRKVSLLHKGESTIGAMKWWLDPATGRLNRDERGQYLGAFESSDQLLLLTTTGEYALYPVDDNFYCEPEDILRVVKYRPDQVISVLYYEGEKGWTMVKRFQIEASSERQRYAYISDHRSSKLYFATPERSVKVKYTYMKDRQKQTQTLDFDSFVDVKGWKAKGNKLGEFKVRTAEAIQKAPLPKAGDQEPSTQPGDDADQSKLKPGDTLEIEF